MNDVAIQSPSVIADMAAKFGMDKRAFEMTIKQTCMPAKVEVTNEQFVAFLLVAKQYNLNPITREIFAFPARNGGIQPVVSVDGWCNIINSHPQLNGFEFEDRIENGKITAITCRMYRKDRAKPVETIEYMSECDRPTDTWKKWPARMLRHKALIQAARYAFGFSGIVDQDEAERAIEQPEGISPYTVDVTKKKSPFKNAAGRNAWHKNVKEAYSGAKSQQEIMEIEERNQPMFKQMRESGDERDMLSLDDLEQQYQLMWKRLAPPREEIEEEDPTFDDDEVPAYIKDEMEAEKDRHAALGLSL